MSRQVILAREAGFCEGVRRAVELAQKAIERCQDKSLPIYSLGRLVHNSYVVEEFQKKGVRVIESLDEVTGPGFLIISAHGVAPGVIEKARAKNLEIIDTTCTWVKKVQELSRKYAAEGRLVLIMGDKAHPEVQGVVEWANGYAKVIESSSEIKGLKDQIQKAALVAQTTQSAGKFQRLAQEIKKEIPQLLVNNTICSATEKRQKSAEELALKVDLMLIIGDLASANTRRLYSLCREINPHTLLLQSEKDIVPAILKNKRTIGITAGASTPNWILKNVLARINDEPN